MRKILILLLGLIVLNGCAKNNTIYTWGRAYDEKVYDILQGKDANIEEHIAYMEKMIDKSNNNGKKLPPGFYAHLGLLHGKLGNNNKMQNCFKREQQLFPESSQYMNFLLSKNNEKEGI